MPYVPGSPIEAFCSHCKRDTNHTVLEASGLQVRYARCTTCSTEGPYRSPKSKYRAVAAAAASARARNAPRKTGTRKTKQTPEELYQAAISGRSTAQARAYDIHEPLVRGALVDHPTFGMGVVLEVPEAQKALVRFRDGEKLLACNRP